MGSMKVAASGLSLTCYLRSFLEHGRFVWAEQPGFGVSYLCVIIDKPFCLCLSLLICKIGLIIVPTAWDVVRVKFLTLHKG